VPELCSRGRPCRSPPRRSQHIRPPRHAGTRLQALFTQGWKLLAAAVGGSNAGRGILHRRRTRRISARGARGRGELGQGASRREEVMWGRGRPVEVHIRHG
jgi:hypothetical protein